MYFDAVLDENFNVLFNGTRGAVLEWLEGNKNNSRIYYIHCSEMNIMSSPGNYVQMAEFEYNLASTRDLR